MARGKCCRRVAGAPVFKKFKPLGISAADLEEIVLTVDEFEAIRLADFEGLYQEEAAAQMNVSRQTFGRILASARRKTARVLVDGLALRIEGGTVEMQNGQGVKCGRCQCSWSEPYGSDMPGICPACKGPMVHRDSDRSEPGKDNGECRPGNRCRMR